VSVIPAEFDLSFSDDGHRLVYDLYGSSAAPLVVYLHGLLLDAELNRGIAQALAEQGYRVALLDLLGHGRSDKPTHASTLCALTGPRDLRSVNLAFGDQRKPR